MLKTLPPAGVGAAKLGAGGAVAAGGARIPGAAASAGAPAAGAVVLDGRGAQGSKDLDRGLLRSPASWLKPPADMQHSDLCAGLCSDGGWKEVGGCALPRSSLSCGVSIRLAAGAGEPAC